MSCRYALNIKPEHSVAHAPRHLTCQLCPLVHAPIVNAIFSRVNPIDPHTIEFVFKLPSNWAKNRSYWLKNEFFMIHRIVGCRFRPVILQGSVLVRPVPGPFCADRSSLSNAYDKVSNLCLPSVLVKISSCSLSFKISLMFPSQEP